MEGLFDLSAKQLERLQEEAPTFWAKLDDEVKGYLQDIIDCGDEMEGMRERMDETLTGVSFDSFYDNFASMLADMDNDSEAFAESFGDYLKKALLSSLLANKYRQRIRDLYDQWAGYSDSDGDGAFDLERDEADQLKEMGKELADAMTAERDAMAEAFGWDAGGGTGRSGRAGGFNAMSQDQDTKLEGMFTSGLQHWSSMDEGVRGVSEQMGTAVDHLRRIEENTAGSAKHLGDIREDIRKIMRDGLKTR